VIDKPVEGVVTVARTHPAGARGAKLSLVEVAERAWQARMSPRLRAWVTQVLDKAGVSTGGRRQKAKAILEAFRKKVPYINDPVMGEFMATPDQLLCLDENGLCIVGGDCFPEETLLLREEGPTLIKNVKVDDMIWGKDAWTRITRKIDKGLLSLDMITLVNGCVVPLTTDHHVFVQRDENTEERVSVAELAEDDVLIQPKIDPFDFSWDAPVARSKMLRGREAMRVRRIDRSVRKRPCWDITTSDGYVYLPEHDVTVSNCDEAAITLAACMLCIGINAMIVGTSHKPPYDVPTHVLMAFQDELQDWVRMDGTTQHAVGQTAPHSREWWLEPGKTQKENGTGDFVGMSEKAAGDLSAPASMLDLRYPGLSYK
jgi:hypothetical protein